MTGPIGPRRLRAAPIRVALLVTRSDVYGGAVVHLRDLALGLQDEGHHVDVLIGGNGPMVGHLRDHGLTVHPLRHVTRAINPTRDANAVRELEAVLRRIGPDVVHGHTAKAGVLARTAARRLGIPAVYTPHAWPFLDGVPAVQKALYLRIERAVAHLPATMINVCEHERGLALDVGVGAADQHFVVHNGVQDVPAHLRGDASVDPPHLLCAARFELQKDHDTLVRALATLTDLDWTCTLAGDGPTRGAVAEQVEALGLADRIDMPGEVDDIAERMARSQAVVLASRWEALPLVLLEAMRAGLPTVATDVGGVREAVVNAETGVLVPRGDATAMANGLRTVVARRDLRRLMGASARQRFEQHFTLAGMVRRTIAVYEDSIVRQRRPDLVRRPLRRPRLTGARPVTTAPRVGTSEPARRRIDVIDLTNAGASVPA